MFVPNRTCRAKLGRGASDTYGQPLSISAPWRTERCSVVRMQITSDKSSVRADSSASRGNAMEILADLKILLTATSQVSIDDILEVTGYKFRVVGIEPRFNVLGRLDHIEVSANIWSAT